MNREKIEQFLNGIRERVSGEFKSNLEDKMHELENGIDKVFEEFKENIFSSLDSIDVDVEDLETLFSDYEDLERKVKFLSNELSLLKEEKELAVNDFSNFLNGAFEIYTNLKQKDILFKLLEAVSKFGNRSLLLLLKKDVIKGWKSYGFKEENFDEKLSNFQINLDESSVLTTVLGHKKIELFSYEEYMDDPFLKGLEIYGEDKFYVVPLVVFGMIPAFIFIDGGKDGKASVVNIEKIQFLCTIAATWIENCTLKRKTGIELTPPSVVKEGIFKTLEVEGEEKDVEIVRDGYKVEKEIVSELESEGKEEEESLSEVGNIEDEKIETVESDTVKDLEFQPLEESKVELVENTPMEDEFIVEENTPVPDIELDSEEIIVSEPQNVDAGEIIDAGATVTAEDLDETEKYELYVDEGEKVNEIEEIELENEPGGEGESIEFESKTPEELIEEEKKDEEAVKQFEEEISGEKEPVESQVTETAVEEVPEEKPLWETPEEEKMHRDAKRFARLLVSEIKLYNEEKVAEGRRLGDLYKRLRKDIDRSREAYEQRVSPIVASKIDYLHEQLIKILAEGNPALMGSEYPGPVIHSEEE